MSVEPRVRPTCISCRDPIGDRDFLNVTGQNLDDGFAIVPIRGVAIDVVYCMECGEKALRALTFDEAVKGKVSVRWIGKTWSFLIPLHINKFYWDRFREALESGELFPKDSLRKVDSNAGKD